MFENLDPSIVDKLAQDSSYMLVADFFDVYQEHARYKEKAYELRGRRDILRRYREQRQSKQLTAGPEDFFQWLHEAQPLKALHIAILERHASNLQHRCNLLAEEWTEAHVEQEDA